MSSTDATVENRFARLLAGLARELRAQDIPYVVVGGQAVLVHGEPRLTADIDVTLGVDYDRLDAVRAVCEALHLRELPEDVLGFVRRTRVLPAYEPETGVRIDFIFSFTPFERGSIERAVRVEVAGEPVAFATAEDLVLYKLFAGRDRDLADAAGVIARQQHLDLEYLRRWAAEFSAIPGRESVSEKLEGLLARYRRG